MSFIIKYGISPNYVPNWSFKEAYREIVQNFLDYNEYNVYETSTHITFSNDYSPDDFNFLKVGFTSKNGGNSRGQYGEGLKLSCLVLARLNLKCEIYYDKYNIKPIIYTDEYLGDCFGFEIDEVDISYNKFNVEIQKPDDWDNYKNYLLTENDVIFEGKHGNIINKEKGSIYVGGLYVTKLDRLSYSYDICPQYIKLGRDRDIPSTWDIEVYTSKINGEYIESENLSIEEVTIENRDFEYIDNISDNIVDQIIPIVDTEDENAEIEFEVKTTGKKIYGYHLKDLLKNHDKMQEKIEKVKVTMKEKLTPHLILKNFMEKYGDYLPRDGQDEFRNIIYKSNDWNF